MTFESVSVMNLCSEMRSCAYANISLNSLHVYYSLNTLKSIFLHFRNKYSPVSLIEPYIHSSSGCLPDITLELYRFRAQRGIFYGAADQIILRLKFYNIIHLLSLIRWIWSSFRVKPGIYPGESFTIIIKSPTLCFTANSSTWWTIMLGTCFLLCLAVFIIVSAAG